MDMLSGEQITAAALRIGASSRGYSQLTSTLSPAVSPNMPGIVQRCPGAAITGNCRSGW
jgi:hypothetical protein